MRAFLISCGILEVLPVTAPGIPPPASGYPLGWESVGGARRVCVRMAQQPRHGSDDWEPCRCTGRVRYYVRGELQPQRP